MRVLRITAAALLTATLTGCIIRARPCRTDCWWSHGQRFCERRCD